MWDIERTPDSALPAYIGAATLESQQWLRHQQIEYGLSAASDRGRSWVIGPRVSARNFMVNERSLRRVDAYGNTIQEKSLLILAKTQTRWNSILEPEDVPSNETSLHPLIWFPVIPWVAHLSQDRESLVLFSPEHRVNNFLFSPAWTLTIPISLTIWKILNEDYMRYTGQSSSKNADHWLPTRFGLGDGSFIPVLGFDIEWGKPVTTPVHINPLIAEFKALKSENFDFIDPAYSKKVSMNG